MISVIMVFAAACGGEGPSDGTQANSKAGLEAHLGRFRSHYAPITLETLEGVHVGVSKDLSSLNHTTQFERVYEGGYQRESDFSSLGITSRGELQFAVSGGKCFGQLSHYSAIDASWGSSCYESSVRTEYSCRIRDDYYLELTVEHSNVLKDELHQKFPKSHDPMLPANVGKKITLLIGRDGNHLGLYPLAPDLSFEWNDPCK